VLEELSFARPGVLAALQTALDERAITLREDGGRVVRFAPGVMVLAADNTDGAGDQSGAYAGTEPMNVALMDRFALIVPCQYLAAKSETRALAAKAGVPVPMAAALVAFAGHVRKAQERGVIVHTMTLRRLIAMARALRDGATVDEAFAMAVLPFFPATDREALVQLRMAHLDAAAITGAPASVPGATATAKGAAAASAFAAAPVTAS
jgi:MoxR-like ATPase